MKYWGKKPHNIWREYIAHYAPSNGVFLDPFAGSAMSAFEAVKAGRKAIAFDINPLTSFIIEVISSEYNHTDFSNAVEDLIESVSDRPIYKHHYKRECPKCLGNAEVINWKWEAKTLYEIGLECTHESKKTDRFLLTPNASDHTLAESISNLKTEDWYPKDSFPESPSFSSSFIDCIGGNDFSSLWTKRNLHILAALFSEILKVENEVLKKQLLFGFIQTLHLCTKMCVPRREAANRAFSTSWGRSAYICASRQMEMNPLLLFRSSCLGKQSVQSAIAGAQEYIGKRPKLLYIDSSNRSNRSTNFDIKYGTIDINALTDYLDPESVDFVMTDPPYGGLVQYLDLSLLWLTWLQKYEKRFTPNLDVEITIKGTTIDLSMYQRRFENGIRNIFKVLKPNGRAVFTFHNKDIRIWNAFLNAITMSGFQIEKVTHQQNRRTGEANVANPYGTSGTDFYIRCVKSQSLDLKNTAAQFEHFIIQKAIQIIAQRSEPTPFQILFNGLLAEMSIAGFNIQDFDKNVESILKSAVGTVFTHTNSDGAAGNLWWFVNPAEYITFPDRQLADRVEETVVALLRRHVSVNFDEVLSEIFITYPNGLTPDIKSVKAILEKYANQANGRWVYKGGEVEAAFTKHTEALHTLVEIGKKLNYKIYIGKREQPETYESRPLSSYADITRLDFIEDSEKRKRIEMIDMLWLDDKNTIVVAIEVENSTNFTSGIQRASNLNEGVKKIMIMPDSRTAEFNSLKDPLFTDNFRKYNWSYMFYSDINRLKSARSLNESQLTTYLKAK